MNEDVKKSGTLDSRHRSLLWGTSWTTLYVVVYFLVKIARGLVIPRFLIPASYGLWGSLSVVLGYTRYADLGVQQQLTKRLPYQLGKEGVAGYWDLAGRGITWMTCVTIAVSLVLVGCSVLYRGSDPWFYRPAFLLLALVVIAQNARALLTTFLVARQEFRIVAVNGSMTDILGLVIAVLGLIVLGIMGLIWALLLSELAGALHCLYHLRRYGMPRLRWQLHGVVELVREGLLLLGVAFLEQMMMTVDQLVILRYFSKEQFGIYALGSFIVTSLIAISGIFLTAQPRILELGGGGQQEQSRRMVEMNVALCLLVSALCIAPFLPLADFTVHFYLKKYAVGIPVFVMMQTIALARAPVILLRSYFLVHHYEKRLIVYQVCGLTLALVLDYLIISRGWGMAYVPLASTVGYLLTGAFMFLNFERGRLAIGRSKYAMLLASIAGVIGLFVFYQHRETESGSLRYITETCGASIVYALLIGGVLLATWRSWLGNLRRYAGDVRIPLLSRQKRWITASAADGQPL